MKFEHRDTEKMRKMKKEKENCRLGKQRHKEDVNIKSLRVKLRIKNGGEKGS